MIPVYFGNTKTILDDQTVYPGGFMRADVHPNMRIFAIADFDECAPTVRFEYPFAVPSINITEWELHSFSVSRVVHYCDLERRYGGNSPGFTRDAPASSLTISDMFFSNIDPRMRSSGESKMVRMMESMSTRFTLRWRGIVVEDVNQQQQFFDRSDFDPF